MALMMRTGLVSFGQGLYYCLGAYAAGALDHFHAASDLLLMVVAGALLAVLVALVLGLLMAKYRDIFFAMLSLAFSMILYGLLVKTSALGSTDGFGLSVKTFAGIAMGTHWVRYGIFAFAAVLAAAGDAGLLRLASRAAGVGDPRQRAASRVHGGLRTPGYPSQLRHRSGPGRHRRRAHGGRHRPR